MAERRNTLSDNASLVDIISAAPGLLCLVDRDGRVAAASPELVALIGTSVPDLVGRSWSEILSGTHRLVEAGTTPLASGGQLHAVKDRAEIERWESRLVESERLAVLGSLAGGIAHQINDALTATRLSLGRLISFELAQTPITPVRQHRIELLQDAREGVSRVEHITKELRAFSQSEAEADGEDRPIDLRTIVESAANLAAHEIRHRARLELDLRALPPVVGGEQALRQVFLNLLINAVQALPEGSADANTIRVSSWQDELGNAVVEVSDTGKGISPGDLGRIFEPFFTTKPQGEGLGLGLSVCRDIVNGLRGHIAAESVPGRGTSIRVVLPPAPPAEEKVKPRAQTNNDRRRILIVDDDRPVAAAVALELEDHDVVVAGSGREAFEILRRDPAFDVVLCDVMMPELSGVDLYNWLRPIEPEMLERFVFMTGGAFTPRAEQFLRDIPNLRLDKPFHPDDLRRVIASVPQRRRSDPSISIRTQLGPRDYDARRSESGTSRS